MRHSLSFSVMVFAISTTNLCRADQIEFDSVDQVLAELHSDTNIEFREEGGWTIAEGNFTIWTFTQPGHPAHPAVVERRVFEDGESIRIDSRSICTADQFVCDELARQFGVRGTRRENDRDMASTQVIEQPGLLISLSNLEEWTVAQRSPVMLVLRWKGAEDGQSVVGAAQLERIPNLTSEQEFLSFVISQRERSLGNDPRVSSPEFFERLLNVDGNTCVKFAYRYIDVGAVLQDGSTMEMAFANDGLRCQHPSDQTIGIRVSYSVRYAGDLDTQSFESSAQRFIDSVSIRHFDEPE